MMCRFNFVNIALFVTLLLFFSDAPLVNGKNLCSRLKSGQAKILLLGLINQGETVMLITSDMKVYEAPIKTAWNPLTNQLTVPTKGVPINTTWPKLRNDDWGDAAVINKNGQDYVVVASASQKGRYVWQNRKLADNHSVENYDHENENYLLVSSSPKLQALIQKGRDVCLHDLAFSTNTK